MDPEKYFKTGRKLAEIQLPAFWRQELHQQPQPVLAVASPLVWGNEAVILCRHLTGQSLLAVVGVAAGDQHVHTYTNAGTCHLYTHDGRSFLIFSDEFREVLFQINIKVSCKDQVCAAAYLLHAGFHPLCLWKWTSELGKKEKKMH